MKMVLVSLVSQEQKSYQWHLSQHCERETLQNITLNQKETTDAFINNFRVECILGHTQELNRQLIPLAKYVLVIHGNTKLASQF